MPRAEIDGPSIPRSKYSLAPPLPLSFCSEGASDVFCFFFFWPHVSCRYAQLSFFQSQLSQGFFEVCFEDFWQNLLWSFIRRLRRCIGFLNHVVYDEMKVFAVYLQVLGQLHCKVLGQAPL